jgi:alkylated DNA nucleotide flippase Atl1
LVESLPAKRKTWCEKLNDGKGLPEVKPISSKFSKRWGSGTLVIPAPLEVDEIMKGIPQGKVTTINEIRAALAKKHNATIGCPITTGIFAWISANAAEERRQNGEENITPYWRTLKTGGFLNEKYPGGVEAQKQLLEKEGHKVVAKGKRCQILLNEEILAVIE